MNAKCLCCCVFLISIAHAQTGQHDRGDEVRDAFLTTRDAYLVSKGGNLATERRRKSFPLNARTVKPAVAALGLGYTLFKKGADGKPVRANPSQEFREGDGVRFMIESNSIGHIYIFHAENDESPKMIFPDPRLNGGENRIKAHVPYETPSREEPGDWWFFFDHRAAAERFYLVVTREPLPEMKTGEALVAYCEKNSAACPWRPSKAVWNRLWTNAEPAARLSRSREFGSAQTETEREAVTRGVELRPGAPAPSVVKMSASPKAGKLVAEIALVHK